VDEEVEPLTVEEEPQGESHEKDEERALTQRELVRASLLRCPPGPAADPPRR